MKLCAAVLFAALAGAAAAAAPAEEFRAMWVCPWELNDAADVDAVVAAAREFHFNALLYEVRYRGDALYIPNKHTAEYPNPEPRSPHLAGRPRDFDPLQELLDRGHAAGLEVHAWVTVFVVANKQTPTPPGHPAVEHPAWLSQNDRGETWDPYGMEWLEAALPEVQDYLYNVFLDIVANYDVDGLHLDYVRYTSPAFGRNAEAIKLYMAETGKPLDDSAAFADWRRRKINAFVNRLYDGVTRRKPQCRLTAAVFASRTGTAYNDCLQDWTAWLGGPYVDAVLPMAYGRNAEVIGRQIKDAVSVANGRHVYAGIMVPEVPASEFDDALGAEMAAKVDAARGAGARGIVVFSYNGVSQEENLVGRALRDGPFSAAAAPPPMPWKEAAPVPTEAAVVAVYVGGSQKYAVRLPGEVPRRHAYLLAKEVSSRLDAAVFIKREPTDERYYRVYAGAFDDRGAAAELRARLAKLGY